MSESESITETVGMDHHTSHVHCVVHKCVYRSLCDERYISEKQVIYWVKI